MPKGNKNLKKQNKNLRNQNKKLKNQIEKYSTQNTKEKDISPYLDFIIFELNRSIRRKDILENKAYILGSLLLAFVFFDRDYFNMYIFFENIYNHEQCIIFIIKLAGIVCCVISFINIYKTLNPSENRYLDAKIFKLEERINETTFEQKEIIIKHHLKTIETMNKIGEIKLKCLSKSIKYGMCFFLTYFLFMLGGVKMEDIELKILLGGKDIPVIISNETPINDSISDSGNDNISGK